MSQTTVPAPSSPDPAAPHQPSHLISGSEPGQPPLLRVGGACHCAWLSPVQTGERGGPREWKSTATKEIESHGLARRETRPRQDNFIVCLGTDLIFLKRLFQCLKLLLDSQGSARGSPLINVFHK